MNNSRPTAYTPLESLLLFQRLSKYGFLHGSFDRISQELLGTPLILEQNEYAASRLTPDALQQLALQLLGEEQRRESETNAERGANGLSPASKKRKLQAPSLPTLQEAHEHPERLPVLIDRLYACFRDDLVRQIREDERLYQQREQEINEIERGEWDERIVRERRVETTVNDAAPVEEDVRPSKTKDLVNTSMSIPTDVNKIKTPTPTPTPTPSLIPPLDSSAIQAAVPGPLRTQEPTKQDEASHTSARPVSPVPPTPSAPLHSTHERRPLQPSPSPLAPAPAAAVAAAATAATPTRPTSEHRQLAPDVRPPEPSRTLSNSTPVLQHPQMVPSYGSRPIPSGQLHIPDGSQRPENFPKAKSPVSSQQGQAQTPPLKWEPPYQPPNHPLQQTPVPLPRPPPYMGSPRPPSYPTGSPVLPQTSLPSAQQTLSHAPQHAQNFPVARQTVQNPPPPRFSTPNANPTSGSVLLPPQTAGPIPPSLQSLPLNTAPDGSKPHGADQRPPSTPVVASPTPGVGRGHYNTYQPAGPATPTPIRQPSGPTATHPAISAPRLPTQPIQLPQLPTSVRHPQPPSHPRPQPPHHQPSIPTTPSQPQQSKGVPRPYGAQAYSPTRQGAASDIVQRTQPPVQLPFSTPHISRPPHIPFTQAPSGVHDSVYVIRGHGTKWISTPTPSTPRVRDMEGYFDTESPAFEPISPPMQASQFPQPSLSAERKDANRPVMKTDMTKPRGRPPKIAQKVELASEPVETPVEPDPPAPIIKNEEAALEMPVDAVGPAVSETQGERIPAALNSLPSKRKRQGSLSNRAPPSPATHVLWTRAFHKISMTALDQIIGHRYANMFAHPIKPRLAPGYYDIILRPQDLKGIQKAITAGSKAAAATVATMSDIEANSPAVWLPISVELVPPRGIINIAQLERELIHMFANAIMYNPDPQRGLGPSFLKNYQNNSEEGEDLRGYEFDENGVVKETRNMFAEVEKLLGDLRSEVVPRAQPIGTGSRSVSAAVGESNTVEEDGGDEPGGDAKRRRIRS